ncbi:hypothetical protein N6H18_14730 [Reichenbachiella agarivorans]|uniref:Right handed beta helix region n=1 Tax=Reichenbachiella agarivorans TaxID=2979464 RepID=A0ABY6CPB3_9BACT|nr:hypothetical protein [Reichenbachiella agarivorans]UXP31604.1 hypothetical protein N6H18_14730 [Reichenbachiella agarivorans]
MKKTRLFFFLPYKTLMLLGFLFISSCNDDSDDPSIGIKVDAGVDQIIELGATVNLDATVTGEDLVLMWEITSKPTGSTAIIANPLVEDASFTPDVVGEYTAQLTAVNLGGDEVSDEVVIVVIQEGEGPLEIGGTISTKTTLVNRFDDPTLPDYIASSLVTVSAELTIDPDVYIIFAEDQGLAIGTGGALIAKGTADKHIIFSGVEKTDGFWMGLELESNNSKNELTYCTIEYGGSSGFDGANLRANLMLAGSAKVKITNSEFTHSKGYGLYTRNLEVNLTGFMNNTFTDNVAPIMTRINHYHYFDAASSYAGNEDDYIDSYVSGQEVTTNVTWQALDVPYRMSANLEYIGADVVIAAGASFLGQPNGGLFITTAGSLKAIGTSTTKITFAGEQDVRGYWRGLSFESNNTSNELTYVMISNGGERGFDGAELKSNIMVEESGRLKITNTSSTKSGGYGLYTRQLESSLPNFANNTFTDNVAPVMTRINHYHYFDAGSNFTGNDDDYIDSYVSGQELTTDVSWQALDVPYRMSANLEYIESDIVVVAGASFIGQPNGGLEVTGTGSLHADGTDLAKITFVGEQDVVGFWRGLRFESNNADNLLNHVIVSNGGERGFDGAERKANIEVADGGLLTLTNSTLSKSGGHAIRVQDGGSLTQSGLTFTGNTGDNIFQD